MSQSTQEELQRAVQQAQRESWPYNDPRANYETAEKYRKNRAEGVERRG